MSVVNEELDFPGSVNASSVEVLIRLAGDGGEPLREAYSGGKTIVGALRPAVAADGTWTADLVPNSAIVPAGTRWRRDVIGSTVPISTAYLNVPVGGPYQASAILSDVPGDIDETPPHGHAGEFVDLITAQSIGGAKTFTSPVVAPYFWANAGTGVLTSLVQESSATGPYISLSGSRVLIGNRTTASNVPLIVQGIAAQSGDLQQWQSSAAAVLAKIDSAGSFSGTEGYFAGAISATYLYATTGTGVLTSIIQESSGTGPYISLNSSRTMVANRGSVSNVPLIVQGIVSQSGDLQQWQNSAATILAKVTAAGDFDASGTGQIRSNSSIVGTTNRTGALTVGTPSVVGSSLFVNTASLSNTYGSGLGIDGAYSSPTSVISIAAHGVYSGGGYDSALAFATGLDGTISEKMRIDSAGNVGVGIAIPTARHHTVNSVAATVATIVRGAASQTADLQQWQDSTPSTIFAITAAGMPRWTAAGNQQTTVGAAGGASALPATPTKYLKVQDSAGTTLVVPAYAAA